MKKLFLLLIAALLLPVAVSAQPIQKIMGHYFNDSIASEGYAISNTTAMRMIGIILEPDELEIYQGGKIVAIRVGLAEATTVSRMFVIPVLASANMANALIGNVT